MLVYQRVFLWSYLWVNIPKTMENHHVYAFLTGINGYKATISIGPFSIAMLNYQRVTTISWDISPVTMAYIYL